MGTGDHSIIPALDRIEQQDTTQMNKLLQRTHAILTAIFIVAVTTPLPAQDTAQNDTSLLKKKEEAPGVQNKRILGIIPNYRTFPFPKVYKPLSTKEKFTIASQDSFDRGTVVLALLFAGEGQLSRSDPSFGQGVKGYAQYAGTSYGDLLIGDYMTEAIYPTLLHQDPRYFRKGSGGTWSRLGYAAGQIFITHGDNGKTEVNYSELIGNSTAVAISNAYYPDNRDVTDAVSKLGTQLGVDMASNILKEFWPDILHKFHHEHKGMPTD
ncbi:MAG TPA: hypothetical protein VHZ07_15830 [Bryobacteraceae bacterium]|jgi:hypothetical protein|nr:hypothetical protein [Bryobacteraceae bacterium]